MGLRFIEQPDIFYYTDYKHLTSQPFDVISKTRTIVDQYVVIDSVQFELYDLYETLYEVKDGNMYITDHVLGEKLLKFDILSSLGSYRCCTSAQPGSNFNDFYERIETLYCGK